MGLVRDLAAAFALASVVGGGYGLRGAGAGDNANESSRGIAYWAAQATRDRFASAADPDKPLALRNEAALHWSNPVRGTGDGALFLWVDRGRPEVAECLWGGSTDGRPTVTREAQSLAIGPLEARRDNKVYWKPKVGVVMTPVPDAPHPAADAPGRLRQMRALAREFAATFGDPPDRAELRPLVKPLYRYELDGARPDLLDGALFAFVHTTDPEVLLLIEARPAAPGGPLAWHYGFGRMSGYSLRAEHKGKEVWRAGWGSNADPTAPSWTFTDFASSP